MSTVLLWFEREKLPQAYRDQICRTAPDMRLLVTRDRDEVEAALDEIEIAAVGFPIDLLPRARNLRWLQLWSAGADWLLERPEAAGMDFVLTNTAGMHAIQIGEHIFALLLAFARRIPQAVRAQAQGRWEPQFGDVFELAGKTMLVVGVGAIGARAAQIAAALEMRVVGVRRRPQKSAPHAAATVGPDRLLDVLPEADFVVLAAPLTPETRGMIGERALRAMKPTAYLVNVGRGGLIDEPALVRALQEGRIAGAALDVFEAEPLPADSPLWGMENVIITAHYAGATPHYDERAFAIFLENLQRYRDGRPLRNVVDKELGY